MNTQNLHYIQKLRDLSRSDIARLSGVSRQAVSAWFRQEEPNVGSTVLHQLSKSLRVSTDQLLRPLPMANNPHQKNLLEAALNWDSLFESLDDFMVALVRHDLRALARLVQVYGLYDSEKIVGAGVWTKFHRYKNHLRPLRREECEKIWNLEQSLRSN